MTIDELKQKKINEKFNARTTAKFVTEIPMPNENGLLGIRGVLILEEQETGDQRFIEDGALTWDEGPWSLMAQIENTDHDGAPLVGRIDHLERVGNQICFTGVLDAGLGAQVAELIQKKFLRGISADLDNTEIEFRKKDGSALTDDDPFEVWMEALTIVTSARIRGGTILPMPAFVETELEIFTVDASVADAHIADARKDLPPSEWFQNPNLKEPTPLQILDDGRVFGHIALWGKCHIGQPGLCVTPPHSNTEYAYFTRGTVRTWCDDCGREELIATGPISAGIGHASLSLSKEQTIAHYDDTRFGAADVAAGEDSYGIWISGRVRPDAAPEQVERLRASSVSGDWRRVNGNLELVAVLSVNTPGYPIPNKTLAHVASGNVQTTLITAPFGLTKPKDEKLEKLTKVTIDLLRKQMLKKR